MQKPDPFIQGIRLFANTLQAGEIRCCRTALQKCRFTIGQYFHRTGWYEHSPTMMIRSSAKSCNA